MAPITSTTTGIPRQTIDDAVLRSLIDTLSSYDCNSLVEAEASKSDAPSNTCSGRVDVEGLVGELERWPQWRFQEMANLYEWIKPLNAMDAAISQIIEDHPALLLIEPSPLPKNKQRQKEINEADKRLDSSLMMADESQSYSHRLYAKSEAEIRAIPPSIIHAVTTILRFLSALLKHATHKSLFNSIHELSNLLSSSNDDIAALALQVLSDLASPPLVHRLQSQETNHHTTMLHGHSMDNRDDNLVVHSRLMALAKGWGTRGCGLGLATCVTADDSIRSMRNFEFGNEEEKENSNFIGKGVTSPLNDSSQGSLPRFAGEVLFEFIPKDAEKNDLKKMNACNAPNSKRNIGADVVTVKLSIEDICYSFADSSTSVESGTQRESASNSRDTTSSTSASPSRHNGKRRKMSSCGTSSPGGNTDVITAPTSVGNLFQRRSKSTAALFFQALGQFGGGESARSKISHERIFALLSHIRLSASFYCQSSRITAVKRRLHALVAVLYAHPSQDVMAGYFHAQPELCTEIADLVRPIVSASSVSATVVDGGSSNVTNNVDVTEVERRQAAIASIVDPSASADIPFAVRSLAVEVLTALVSRKDDNSTGGGGLSHVSRQTNVLSELGVAKGHFLGLLPTLIRYSLASLNVFLTGVPGGAIDNDKVCSRHLLTCASETSLEIDELGLDLGLTFLEANKQSSFDEQEREEKALEFVEIVLSLASSIVSVASGTSALTDCGLVPALVSTIALTSNVENELSSTNRNVSQKKYCTNLLRFITAQAIQILEGAIVTHSPALAAFHDLKAVDLLIKLLHSEFQKSLPCHEGDVVMQDLEDSGDKIYSSGLEGSTRVLLFSILNCLTIVLHHQESNPRSTNAPITPSEVLRKPEMTSVLNGIILHVHSYGGVLCALATTLISDIMNSDPKIVHYVYECGLADTIFRMLKGKSYGNHGFLDITSDIWHEPNIPASSELIMSLPNLIIALALTDDGRKKILEVNPIPELLSLLCTPKFSMPHSRCMLNEMASLIGTGLDELMRHVPSMKKTVIKSLVILVKRVVHLGTKMSNLEDEAEKSETNIDKKDDCRICLVHYASNVGQALEHILQNEENCSEFVSSGGVEAILKLHPLLILRGKQFLAHVSCQSSPSAASLSHSTASSALITAIKRCSVNDSPTKIMGKVARELKLQLDTLEEASLKIREVIPNSNVLFRCSDSDSDALNISGILNGIPQIPLNVLQENGSSRGMLLAFSSFLREIFNTEWMSQVMSEIVRVAGQRMPLARNARSEWQKQLASDEMRSIMQRLGLLYRTSMSEVCRIRSTPQFDMGETERWKSPGQSDYYPATYRLRIVCCDGAIVRDGLDIDSCSSVGGLEMGEEVDAFDRCVNRSGIMRYRIARGWVSEQTRGHSREPICEVLCISGNSKKRACCLSEEKVTEVRKPIDFGISNLSSLGASILARLQISYSSFFSSMSRSTMVGFRNSRPSVSQSNINSHVGIVVRDVGMFLRKNFDLIQTREDDAQMKLGSRGVAMYFGNALSILHSCLCEDSRRDRQLLNVFLLCNILYHDGLHDAFILPSINIDIGQKEISSEVDKKCVPSSGFYGAIRYVLKHSLSDIAQMETSLDDTASHPKQRVSKTVASCFPATLSLLGRLSSQSLSIEPDVVAVLRKTKFVDFSLFLHENSDEANAENNDCIFSFQQNSFARVVHCNIGAITHELWKNPELKNCPPHVLEPLFILMREVLSCLQDSVKEEGNKIEENGESSTIPQLFRINAERNLLREGTALSGTSANDSTSQDNNAPDPKVSNAPNNADVKNGTASGKKQMTDSELKKMAEKHFDSLSLAWTLKCYKELRADLTRISLNILEGSSDRVEVEFSHFCIEDDWIEETNASAIIVSSFLLENAAKNAEERVKLIDATLERLMDCIDIGPKASQTKIKKTKDRSFASLCLLAGLLLRALPKTRTLVLKKNLVTILTHCSKGATSKLKSSGPDTLPPWISSVLLFLEMMAQPMSLPVEHDEKESSQSEKHTPTKQIRRDDYERVCSEHKKQRASLAKTSKKISAVLSQNPRLALSTDNKLFSAFTDFPAFAPLITPEVADHCLSICLQILRLNKRNKKDDNSSYLRPEIAHSATQLLARVLIFHKVASRCLKMGGAEVLLSLHFRSRFKGHVSLVTLALRRMIEDEKELQNSMEIEIRRVLTKILKKQSSGNGSDAKFITGKVFLQAVTHLICRDPVVFLRAAGTSLSIKQSERVSADSKESKIRVSLMPSDVRSKNAKLLAECFRGHTSIPHCDNGDISQKTPSKGSHNAKKAHSKTPASKSPHHKRGKRSAKKEKQEKGVSISGSAAAHVASQILTEMIKSHQLQQKVSNIFEVPFFCTFEFLEILGDLLLAVPACAAAIYNYRLPNHVVKGQDHPRGALGYLLHVTLPQPREVLPESSHDMYDEQPHLSVKKREAFVRIRIAQCSARLIVALVARAGEGRHRVVSELSLALKGKAETKFSDHSMWALQAWGELCLGLAAPRARTPNADHKNASLSFEVVKIMSEYKMAHSLMNALQRISLDHPLAAATSANLLRPLEILTRPTIVDTLQEMAEREDKKRKTALRQFGENDEKAEPKKSSDIVEDGMLGDDFDATSAASDQSEEDLFEGSSASDNETSSDDEDMISSSEDDSLSDDDDEHMSSSSDEEENDDDDNDDDDQIEILEEVINQENEEDSESNADPDEIALQNNQIEMEEEAYEEEYPAEDDNDDFFEVEEEVDEEDADAELREEGWENIDSTDLGSMLFSSRPGAAPVGRPRAGGGLMIEAATSVLNNILRSGEIQMDALAEIEQTLGIRLPDMQRVRSQQPEPAGRNPFGQSNGTNPNTQGTEPMGERPTVQQSNPPDIGYQISDVEYHFGGPIVGSSRVYYNLRGSIGLEEEERAHRVLPVPSAVEAQLFPGGPATCTHIRAPIVPHIFLAGVNLAPSNAMLSLSRRLEDPPRVQRFTSDPFGAPFGSPYGGNFLFTGGSTITGHTNVIRLHRSPAMSLQARRAIPEDNGEAADTMASNFSTAFERSLATFGSRLPDQSQAQGDADASTASNQQNMRAGGDEVHHATVSETLRGENRPSDTNERQAERTQLTDNSGAIEDDAAGLAIADQEETINAQDSENVEGEVDVIVDNNISVDRRDVEMVVNEALPTDCPDGDEASEGRETIGQEAHNSTSDQVTGNSSLDQQIDAPIAAGEAGPLRCPAGMDPEVFAQLPFEMQQEVVEQNSGPAVASLDLDTSSNLDPEVLAALPEELRQEVIEQERNERRLRQQEQETSADPAQAEDIDPASFIASLAPDLREEILLTSDDEFLSQLPPDILAEARLLQERAIFHRHRREIAAAAPAHRERQPARQLNGNEVGGQRRSASTRRRTKSKVCVDCDRSIIAFTPPDCLDDIGPLLTPISMKALFDLMFLLSPVRPQKLLQKLFQNFSYNPDLRKVVATSFISLLNDEPRSAIDAIHSLGGAVCPNSTFPSSLIGIAPESTESEPANSRSFFRRRRDTGAATAIAMNLPLSAITSGKTNVLPPVVARRIFGTLTVLTKNVRLSLDILSNFDVQLENTDRKPHAAYLDTLLGLLAKTKYTQSSSNLGDLLGVIEGICAPLSTIPTDDVTENLPTKREIEAAASDGKEYVGVPRSIVSPSMLKLLCSILRFETCKDSLFSKVSVIARRLCRVEANRQCILVELASVAGDLGRDAIRDLRSLRIRLDNAVRLHYNQLSSNIVASNATSSSEVNNHESPASISNNGTPSSAVTLSTNNTELKLLRVLQVLHNLCTGTEAKKSTELPIASKELVNLLEGINLTALWEQLTGCLNIVSVLEGVTKVSGEEDDESEVEDDTDVNGTKGGKKLQNSVAGLLTRFLPTVEAFFVVNACSIERGVDEKEDKTGALDVERLVGGESLLKFISKNKVLLNALLRSNPSLLDKGLRAMVQVPRCTSFLDFDVKRHWFKQQVRKLRSQASRRHGNLRLSIRRQYVFEDAYRQLRMRNADEMRGRLHITFANEEGVDAGGLSREFFGILAKEMFNPNYALFTSTEDGCTFQPNPQSSINRDHLHYFNFVGRIVGKAVADGYLLDAHFTRSLYKHMLGIKPTYQDMEAIDPEYYKSLKTLLGYKLEDIGLDLTFSSISQWFGRSQIVDLIPNGRNIPVTEEEKEKYVGLVCEHRMTTAIQKQIKAYLDGFYELVNPAMISIFTPQELELLISGMPDIDILDLKKNTEYNGYRTADKEIGWFWNIMFSLSKSEKASFLQFVTGSSKVPLNGFSELQGMRGIQKFSIHKAGGSAGALMSAHTCFNSLDLPVYKSEEQMREKLLYAIMEGAGSFQFS